MLVEDYVTDKKNKHLLKSYTYLVVNYKEKQGNS